MRLRRLADAICAGVVGLSAIATGAVAEDTRTYRAEIVLNWVQEDGVAFPDNAHWSRLIAITHATRWQLFRDGDTATSGVALVATNGRVSVLEAELSEARRRGRVGEALVLPGTETGQGHYTFEIMLSPDMPAFSFATMIAPSPDWFSGISGLSPLIDGEWQKSVSAPIWVWDAGVDSGSTFVAPNEETQPRQSVRILTHPGFLHPDGFAPIGSVTLSLSE